MASGLVFCQDGGMNKHPLKDPDHMVQSYEHHLREVAGLSQKTCLNQTRDIRRFLAAAKIRRTATLAKITAVEVSSYLAAKSAEYQPASLQQVASSLRQFFRFARQQGWIRRTLDLAVPSIACRSHQLPGYSTEPQLETLLASWDRRTVQGRRDLAIGLCLARLGLRAAEVAALCLEDLDWRRGILRIKQSKNGRAAELPLLKETGQAIANYLRAGRPQCSRREVFLLDQPPRPLNAKAVSEVIRHALRHCRIQFPRAGAHVLRHTLASHLVQNGASLKEAADVLRHQHLNSAAVYSHLDVEQLRSVAQPWPKEATL